VPPSQTADAVAPVARKPVPAYITEEQKKLQQFAMPYRLTPRQRAEARVAINDFYINIFLERRRCLPAYRTISKAKKSALEGCFALLDQDGVGGGHVREAELLLRSVDFPEAVISEVIAAANTDDNSNLSRAEFMRVCVEADKRRRALDEDGEEAGAGAGAGAGGAAAGVGEESRIEKSSASSRRVESSLLAAPTAPSPRPPPQRPPGRPKPRPRWVGTGGAGASTGIGPTGAIRGTIRFFDNGGSAIDNGGGVGGLKPGQREVPYFTSPRDASEAIPLKLLMECRRIHSVVDAYVATLEDSTARSAASAERQADDRRGSSGSARSQTEEDRRRPAPPAGVRPTSARGPKSRPRGGATRSGVPIDVARKLQIRDD
jgi:hypothetical protein